MLLRGGEPKCSLSALRHAPHRPALRHCAACRLVEDPRLQSVDYLTGVAIKMFARNKKDCFDREVAARKAIRERLASERFRRRKVRVACCGCQ